MSVRSAQSITTMFTTNHPTTGSKVDADSTPSGTLYLNGTADGASVTVTNVATGLYKAAVTLPTLAVGDVVSIVISATVDTITSLGKVWEDSKDMFAGAIPDVIAGGAGGLFIAGTNAATVVTTSFTTTFTGNLTGNVGGSVASIGANGIAAATFAADVDAEILSYIVDDATRIDASDLNAKIDSLTFTVSGKVNANIHYVNNVEVDGDGETGTEWGPV